MKDSNWDTRRKPPDRQDLEFVEPPKRSGHIFFTTEPMITMKVGMIILLWLVVGIILL